MEKSEVKSDINIFEENRELKQEIVGLKKENAKLREEIRTLKEQIEKISATLIGKISSADEIVKSVPENKESPKVPAWLPDVLDWIRRTELAQSSLSTASWAFNQYCWRKLHGKVKARIVPKLRFTHEWDEEGNFLAKLEKANDVFIPIASTNPPEYIIGFKEINFFSVDGRVLQFIRSIIPLLNDITIKFDCDLHNIGPISRLLALIAPKTFELEFEGFSRYELRHFAKNFPNVLDKIQAISRFIHSDSDDVDFLAKWLSTPRDDGKPRCFYTYISHQSEAIPLFDQVEKEFLDSMEPANFIVFFECHDRVDLPIFIMENEGTNEILESYRKQDSHNENKHFLIRHQKSGEAQRANWEEEFNQKLDNTDNTILML